MKSPILTAACLFAAAGLAPFDKAIAAEAPQRVPQEAPQQNEAPGVVRITDAGRFTGLAPVPGFRLVSESNAGPPAAPPADQDAKGCAPGGCAPVSAPCWTGAGCPQGEIIWEGKPRTMTGIAPIDWLKTAHMMSHARMAAHWHKTTWYLSNHHKECECPPEGYGDCKGGYGCPPRVGTGLFHHGCHPAKCGPNGCGPHCALKHGWDHSYDPGRFGYLQPYGIQSHGHYSAAYPVNPWYFDQRDGRVYASEKYGVPMAVPIAPNVEYTYNYSWGVPASRLTPLSQMPPDSRGLVPAAAP